MADAHWARCECGYWVERCCVPGCPHPRLSSAPTCYGHTVDENDPRHIPTAQFDGEGRTDG